MSRLVPALKTAKKPGALKLFNGRIIVRGKRGHGYIAAYSKEDAIRILDHCVGGRGNRTEINVYWHHGAWGNSMDGITPERGLWFVDGDGYLRGAKPERIM